MRDTALSFESNLSHSSVVVFTFSDEKILVTLSRILGFVPFVACCFAGLFLQDHCWRALCHCPGHVLAWLIIHNQFCVLFIRQQMALLLVLILYVISLHSVPYQAMRNGLDKSVISQERYLWLNYLWVHSQYVFFDEKEEFLDAHFSSAPFGRWDSNIFSFWKLHR